MTPEEKKERQKNNARKYRARNLEKTRAQARASAEKNREARLARAVIWRQQNKEKVSLEARIWNLKKYNLTVKQYEEKHEEQSGLCAICGKPSTTIIKGVLCRLSVDHNHNTGKVRDLLCNGCNLRLGKLLENPSWTKLAIEYLIRHDSWDTDMYEKIDQTVTAGDIRIVEQLRRIADALEKIAEVETSSKDGLVQE